jgi:putative transposase
MGNYRRDNTKGGTWFFTVNLADRSSALLTENIEALRAAHRYTLRNHPFKINAMVVLPEHLHAIWTLPEDDADFSTRWRLIKTEFTRALRLNEKLSPSRTRQGERGIWQRRFWEHKIRDEIDFSRHVDYIHINPVKHGYVNKVVDWPWSSFHQYVRYGLLTRDWAGEIDSAFRFGEKL